MTTSYLGYGFRSLYLPSVYASNTRWVLANARINHYYNGGGNQYFADDEEAQFRYNLSAQKAWFGTKYAYLVLTDWPSMSKSVELLVAAEVINGARPA